MPAVHHQQHKSVQKAYLGGRGVTHGVPWCERGHMRRCPQEAPLPCITPLKVSLAMGMAEELSTGKTGWTLTLYLQAQAGAWPGGSAARTAACLEQAAHSLLRQVSLWSRDLAADSAWRRCLPAPFGPLHRLLQGCAAGSVALHIGMTSPTTPQHCTCSIEFIDWLSGANLIGAS